MSYRKREQRDKARTDERNPSSTKRGPGRKHEQGDGKDKRQAGVFGRGLLNKWNRARQLRMGKHPLRDEHGAVTLVGAWMYYGDLQGAPPPLVFTGNSGKCRRVWLAGISAQRGY